MHDLFADTFQQINKLSIYKQPMQFFVSSIEFDFTDDEHSEGDVPLETQEETIDDCIGTWEADDEDDLIEEITCAAGWCIKSIDYTHVLN